MSGQTSLKAVETDLSPSIVMLWGFKPKSLSLERKALISSLAVSLALNEKAKGFLFWALIRITTLNFRPSRNDPSKIRFLTGRRSILIARDFWQRWRLIILNIFFFEQWQSSANWLAVLFFSHLLNIFSSLRNLNFLFLNEKDFLQTKQKYLCFLLFIRPFFYIFRLTKDTFIYIHNPYFHFYSEK